MPQLRGNEPILGLNMLDRKFWNKVLGKNPKYIRSVQKRCTEENKKDEEVCI
jgi:hypothetical protein